MNTMTTTTLFSAFVTAGVPAETAHAAILEIKADIRTEIDTKFKEHTTELATKADLNELRLATKADISELKADLAQLEVRMFRVFITGIGLLAALNTVLKFV